MPHRYKQRSWIMKLAQQFLYWLPGSASPSQLAAQEAIQASQTQRRETRRSREEFNQVLQQRSWIEEAYTARPHNQ